MQQNNNNKCSCIFSKAETKKQSTENRKERVEDLLTVMLPPMKQAKPLEPNIDIILSMLGLLNFFKRHAGKLTDPVLGEELHRILLNLDLLLRVYTLPELLLQDPVTPSLLHTRLQPGGVDVIGRGGSRGGGNRRSRRGGGDPGFGTKREVGGGLREEGDRERSHGVVMAAMGEGEGEESIF